MSDEEKEAIEILKLYFGDNPTLNITKYVNIVLNLIEKQSKEIEELKQNIHLKEVYVLKTNDYIKGTNIEDELCNKKWEDKIKAKIEELEKLDFGTDLVSQFTANLTTITILQSLLEKE